MDNGYNPYLTFFKFNLIDILSQGVEIEITYVTTHRNQFCCAVETVLVELVCRSEAGAACCSVNVQFTWCVCRAVSLGGARK